MRFKLISNPVLKSTLVKFAFHIIGLIGWVVVAVMWNDRALIIINTIGLVIYINGMLQYVMGS